MMRMKKASLVALLALSLCAVFALVGCGQKPVEEPKEPEPIEVTDAASTEPFYVLVVGNDSRVGTTEIDLSNYADGTGRSDTTMLVRVDPVAHAVAIVTVPRDTACTYEGATMKINETYRQGGIEALKTAVADLTGVEADYFLDLGFVDFEDFVTSIGGVSANVPINMQLKDIVSGDKISLGAGAQDLNGAEALVLARSRKQYADDLDACRQIQDRQLLQAMMEKVLADGGNAEMYVDALLAVADTDFDRDALLGYVQDFANNADAVTFVSGTGPYKGDIDEANGGMWLATRDEATWARVIETVEAGGDPQTVVALPAVRAL